MVLLLADYGSAAGRCPRGLAGAPIHAYTGWRCHIGVHTQTDCVTSADHSRAKCAPITHCMSTNNTYPTPPCCCTSCRPQIARSHNQGPPPAPALLLRNRHGRAPPARPEA